MNLDEMLHKKKILAQIAHLFFAYHDITLTVYEANKYECIIQTNKALPQELRDKFLDKFELTHMELETVKYDKVSGDVCYIYKKTLSRKEKELKLWLDSSMPVHHTGPIMFQPGIK